MIFKLLFLIVMGLSISLYAYIRVSEAYKSLVNKRGVKFEGIVFDADTMPTIQDEAMNQLKQEGFGI